MTKVLVAMSGGTDSSAAAALLKERGYYVEGGIMLLNGETDTAPARRACDDLGIKLNVFDMRKEFSSHVIEPFCEEYKNNRTPNPCISCNKHLKFGKLLDTALSLGFDKLATGHYAKITCEDGVYRLKKAANLQKDQSYVLYNMTEYTLSHVLFPLSDFASKDEVRQYLAKRGISAAQSKDSQDICFIPNGDYADFIIKNTGYVPQSGDFVDASGNILGKHKGLLHYTIGQRRFLNISLGKRAYVIDKSLSDNTVTLGDKNMLYKSLLICKDLTFTAASPAFPSVLQAVTRYKKAPVSTTVTLLDGNRAKCEFSLPQCYVTPGQSIVFYDGDYVIGGGIIE